MKYTEKQIYKAFLQWHKEIKLQPDSFMSDDELAKLTTEELAEANTKDLIKYLNK